MHSIRRGLVAVVAALAAAPAAHAQTPEPLQAALKPVGEHSFEPTLGVDRGGRVYFSVTRAPGVAAGWRPGMFMSADRGDSWKDISPTIGGRSVPLETNDPFIYVDQATGRAFNFHMSPVLACTMLSSTDDQGASWWNNPVGCGGEIPFDHQTLVAAKPRLLPTSGYPNLLLQCVNSIHSEECSRSIDGGRTWMPTNPAYPNPVLTTGKAAGTQTGHLAAAPDGTIYLPGSDGGTNPVVYVTTDDGLTWTRRLISTMAIPFTDPAIAVDRNGTLYATWVDAKGQLFYAVSRDRAQTWTAPVTLASGLTGTLPALDVGDPGRVAIAFPGTEQLPNGFATANGRYRCGTNPQCVGWNAYLAVSTNGLDAAPSFAVAQANQDGPLFRGATACASGGRCDYITDFIDVTVGPDGRPYGSFSRGCTGDCLTDPTAKNNETDGWGMLATLVSGPTLCETGCGYRFTVAPGVAAARG